MPWIITVISCDIIWKDTCLSLDVFARDERWPSLTWNTETNRANVNERRPGEINTSHISDGADQHSRRVGLLKLYFTCCLIVSVRDRWNVRSCLLEHPHVVSIKLQQSQNWLPPLVFPTGTAALKAALLKYLPGVEFEPRSCVLGAASVWLERCKCKPAFPRR